VLFTRSLEKIEFAFSNFSTILYAFSKFQLFGNTIEDSVFHWGPWKDFGVHTYTLGSQKRPWKEVNPCNRVLGGRPPAVPVGFRQGGYRGRWGEGREGPVTHLEVDLRWFCRSGRPVAAADAASLPAKGQRVQGKEWAGEVEWDLEVEKG
jgi:hypothetical protein